MFLHCYEHIAYNLKRQNGGKKVTIELENLGRKFQSGLLETTALHEVSLHINQGEFLAIMGPSGCGKSTLLSILGMLDKPTSGKIRFFGHNIIEYNERQLAELRRGSVGFIFQSFNLIDELSVYENVELPLLYQNTPVALRKEKVEAVLKRVGMNHRAGHLPTQLSGGQQQRVAIARALVTEPKVILADEPTGNLDSNNSTEILQMLQACNRAGATIIMVTHSESESDFASRKIRLLDGQVMLDINNVNTLPGVA
ncbi:MULTISPECIES: ABC transporter ATP-binding protein [Pseudoalteromonas]|uniref:ABC transporter domain-containing protein n=1 Tax=Pseudoalteromonas piscicida TaxID=43662 RepID=A0ABM6NHX2_PSEO7|nr:MULTISPECIES: ABC transporter ATP-binding protein [Pseudoalteromonas]ATD08354.1 hypothetical protein PPIS_a3589 [Pseudoalteromonas piscicida]MCO7200346.1 ABC transporter ATP-binding protein [Pseudoalteromonas sp. OANN1]WPU34574.1 ABC transporter ATP-binding protein [Pseudoalteromonas piscicida]